MKLTKSIWLATSLLCAFALGGVAQAATRPHYGGTLRISISGTITSLDPANLSNTNLSSGAVMQHIAPLLYDTLTIIDRRGEVQPSLALAWKSSSNATHWELQLRDGIKFSDGTLVTIGNVAESLHAANPQWAISYTAGSISIETPQPDAELPAELSLVRNGIVLRDNAKLLGTGPFTVTQWNTGKTLTLSTREDYWGGRAFLESVEITFGRTQREQMLALDMSRADVIELSPEQARHVTNASILFSEPDTLLALVFNRNVEPNSDQEARLRRAFSLSLDRTMLNNVVLQGTAEPAGGLLPNWMTGYEFVFPSSLDLDHARAEHAGINQSTPWHLIYDAADPISRVIAERLALNAQDAGLDVRPTSGPGDVWLVQIPLASPDAPLALSQLAATLGLPSPAFHGSSAEELYTAENTLLQSQRIIPLLHLRQAVGLARNVHGWSEGRDGSWNLPDVWIETKSEDK